MSNQTLLALQGFEEPDENIASSLVDSALPLMQSWTGSLVTTPSISAWSALWLSQQHATTTGWDGVGTAAIDGLQSIKINFGLRTGSDSDPVDTNNVYKTLCIGFRYKPLGLVDGGALDTRVAYLNTTGAAANDFILLWDRSTLRWKVTVQGVTYTSDSQVVVIGTWYHVELCVTRDPADNSAGYFRLQVNGEPVAGLDLIGVTMYAEAYLADGDAGGWFRDITFGHAAQATPTGAYDDMYIRGSVTEAWDEDDFFATPSHIPILTSLTPESQGSESGWNRYTDPGGLIGAGDSTNYTYVDELPADQEATHLRPAAASSRDSWMLSPLSSAAGTIFAVMSNVNATSVSGGTGTTRPRVGHLFIIGGVEYQHPDDAEFAWLDGPYAISWQMTTRWWASNPSTRGWAPSDFITPIEFGVYDSSNVAGDVAVSQASVLVLWSALGGGGDGGGGDANDVGAPCVPCETTFNAIVLDSMVSYDGSNSFDGGVTASASTMTLAAAPSGVWTAGSSHNLTCSSASFAIASIDWTTRKIKLVGQNGDVVIFTPTAETSDSVLVGTVDVPVPPSMQAVALSTWAIMLDTITLAHLPGKSIKVIADGLSVGPFTADGSGVVVLDDHAAVIYAGLLVTSRLETLDLDLHGLQSAIADKQKNVLRVSLFLEATSVFKMGSSFDHLDEFHVDPLHGQPSGAQPTALFTRKLVDLPRRGHRLDDGGRTYIQADSGLPVTILGLVSNVVVSDNNKRGGG